MNHVLDTIERNNYVATTTQVEGLARDVVQGIRAGVVYLRVLVADCQSKLGGGRRRIPAEAQEAVIDAAHGKFYSHVQKGAGPEDMPAPERHRKTIFARTMASTLRGFVSRGGDLRTLDVHTVTKTALDKAGKVVPSGTRAERSLAHASEVVERAAERLAKQNTEAARERLTALITSLQSVVDELPVVGEPAPTRTVRPRKSVRGGDRGPARTRVGVPQLHRSM